MAIAIVAEPSKKSTATVSVVVLNFNGKKHLKNCLDSLLATHYSDLQVIVVDNGSCDGSADFVKTNYPNVSIVRHDQNYGFAQGYNIVIRNINSNYVALVNNDVVVEPNWLIELVSALEKSSNIAAVTPKMLFLHNRGIINAAGGICDDYGVGMNRGNGHVDTGQYEKFEEVFYGNGGALLITKKAWRNVGPFDERYFMYAEDLDWCWRARLKGYSVFYVPTSRVYHQWGGSRESRMVYMLERHWLSTLIKNYTIRILVLLLPRLMGLKFMKMLWLARHGKPKERHAVTKAFLWNLANFRSTWTKRILVQASRKVPDADIRKLMHDKSLELSIWLGITDHPILKKN